MIAAPSNCLNNPCESQPAKQARPTKQADVNPFLLPPIQRNTRRISHSLQSRVTKYLATLAVPESRKVEWIARTFEHILVVPLLGESPNFLDGVRAVHDPRCLVIAVVNETPATEDSFVHANRTLLEFFNGHQVKSGPSNTSLCDIDGRAVLVVDRTRTPLGVEQGVGWARRIGFDIATALWSAHKLTSNWIHTTDADTGLAADYFDAIRDVGDATAITHRYRHTTPDTDIGTSTALYDLSLRYYTLGLRYAGSPYAHQCLGSTIAVRVDAYAAVRGVPDRQAGEDFYLLNKLRKLGTVHTPETTPIQIAARPSLRVPFGTGPSAVRISNESARGAAFKLYAPSVFDDLGTVQRFLAAATESSCVDELGTRLAECARTIGLERILGKSLAQTPSTQLRRARLRDGFDALRALRLIHELERRGAPKVPWRDAIAEATFVPALPLTPALACAHAADVDDAQAISARTRILQQPA